MNMITALLGFCLGASGVFGMNAATVMDNQVSLPAVFSDHMVLQRGTKLPVWGKAQPGAGVVVEINGHRAQATADSEGAWRAELPALDAGGPHELSVRAGGVQAIVLRDVLVGEVWIASGQSNMEWPLSQSQPGLDDVGRPFDEKLRVFYVERKASKTPVADVEGTWERASEASLGRISGVGYAMAAKLREELGVPVGLIHTAFGGSPAEAWMPTSALAEDPDFAPILGRLAQQEAEHEVQLAEWRERAALAEEEGREAPPEPQGPFGWLGGYKPGVLWNAMLEPLAPFRVAGVIWYQGESNSGRAVQYRRLLPAMIDSWRRVWERDDLPFGIVQLPNWAVPYFPPEYWSWAEVREAQQIAADSDPHTGLVVTIDAGDATDLHPKHKQTIGHRLALWALSDVYGRDVASSGPRFEGMRVEGEKVILSFGNAGSGLRTRDGQPPKGFIITENNSSWDWANAEIVGNTIVLTGNWMPHPIAVRYAWSDNPQWANVCNSAGLPLAPFRTDSQPEVTRDAK